MESLEKSLELRSQFRDLYKQLLDLSLKVDKHSDQLNQLKMKLERIPSRDELIQALSELEILRLRFERLEQLRAQLVDLDSRIASERSRLESSLEKFSQLSPQQIFSKLDSLESSMKLLESRLKNLESIRSQLELVPPSQPSKEYALQISQLQDGISELRSGLNELESRMKSMETRLESISQPPQIPPEIGSELENLRAMLESSRSRYDAEILALRSELAKSKYDSILESRLQKLSQRLDRMQDITDQLRDLQSIKDLSKIMQRFSKIDSDLDRMEQDISKKLEKLEQRLGSFEKFSKGMEKLTTSLEKLSEYVSSLSEIVKDLLRRVESLEKFRSKLESKKE